MDVRDRSPVTPDLEPAALRQVADHPRWVMHENALGWYVDVSLIVPPVALGFAWLLREFPAATHPFWRSLWLAVAVGIVAGVRVLLRRRPARTPGKWFVATLIGTRFGRVLLLPIAIAPVILFAGVDDALPLPAEVPCRDGRVASGASGNLPLGFVFPGASFERIEVDGDRFLVVGTVRGFPHRSILALESAFMDRLSTVAMRRDPNAAFSGTQTRFSSSVDAFGGRTVMTEGPFVGATASYKVLCRDRVGFEVRYVPPAAP